MQKVHEFVKAVPLPILQTSISQKSEEKEIKMLSKKYQLVQESSNTSGNTQYSSESPREVIWAPKFDVADLNTGLRLHFEDRVRRYDAIVKEIDALDERVTRSHIAPFANDVRATSYLKIKFTHFKNMRNTFNFCKFTILN